jgi:hypothetical protein
MGLLMEEWKRFERSTVKSGTNEATRDILRATFFAGGASITNSVAQQILHEPETLPALLRHFANDIAVEGVRQGFDWGGLVSEPAAPPVPDHMHLLSHFVDLSRLPEDSKAELFEIVEAFAARYGSRPSTVN